MSPNSIAPAFDLSTPIQGIEGADLYHDAAAARSQGCDVMAAFKATDVTRAVRVALNLNLPVSGYEIAPDGRIVVYTAGERDREDDADLALDKWKRENGQG